MSLTLIFTAYAGAFVILLTFLAALCLTRVMIVLGPKLGLVDIPSARRVHTGIIPRAGGIAVFLAMVAGMAMLQVTGTGFTGPMPERWLQFFIPAALLLVFTGIIDDRRSLSAFTKLGAQISASVIVFCHSPEGMGNVFGLKVHWMVDLSIHVAWTVALINAFNLIDGMDGLCAGLGLISLTILSVLVAAGPHPQNAFVTGVMAAALAGFLRYNFYPARIFLGDAGSMLLGFFIASAGGLTAGRNAATAGILLPLLVAGVPLFDVFLAVWRRFARRLAQSRPGGAVVRIFGPDRDHLHHRLLDWGLNQRQAAAVIYAIAVVVALLGLLPTFWGPNMLSLSLAGLTVIGLIGLRYVAPVEFMESGRGLRALIRRPRGFKTVAGMYFLFDTVVLAMASSIAVFLTDKALAHDVSSTSVYLREVSVFTACTLLGLRFGGAHTRRWMRAGVSDFIECILWLICGAGLSVSVLSTADADISYRLIITHLCALALGGTAVFAMRGLGLSLLEGVVDTMHRKRRMKTKCSSHTALLYGAGDLGELFACHLRLSPPDAWRDFHFVGFVDDVKELKGRRLRGFRIHGTTAELKNIVALTGANTLMITASTLTPERKKQLERQCGDLSLKMFTWIPELAPLPVPIPPAALPEATVKPHPHEPEYAPRLMTRGQGFDSGGDMIKSF